MTVPVEILVAGASGIGVILFMQFKINRCIGRLEGMFQAHLDKK